MRGVRELCLPGAVEAAFRDPEQTGSRWPLLFYALWWSLHIGSATRQEVAESLLGG